MVSRKAAISRQFNRSATGSYDVHAYVQREMADRLASSLKQWSHDGKRDRLNILEIGCGTGTLTEMVVNEWPGALITALDIAPAMVEAAEKRIRLSGSGSSQRDSTRVQFLLEDVEMWAANAPESSFDLIVSSACFQWLSDPKQTLKHLGRLLRDRGLLAFATFGPDTFHELHSSFDYVYRNAGMEPERHGLSFQSADQWKGILYEAGFTDIRHEQSCRTAEYASVRDFLLSVKAQGASTSEAARSGRPVSRRLFDNLFQAYEHKFRTPNGIAATYDLLFIQALKT